MSILPGCWDCAEKQTHTTWYWSIVTGYEHLQILRSVEELIQLWTSDKQYK
jgi:hypothetical protein